MVILQFNKLIRNKWIWGAFAVAISAFFAFDFLIPTGREVEERRSGAGKLGGEDIDAAEFIAVAEDVRGIGNNRDWKRKSSEVNRAAWETLAAMAVADRQGLTATRGEVDAAITGERYFCNERGQFDANRFRQILAQVGVTPKRYREFLARRITAGKVAERLAGAAAWASPMEIDRGIADMTDQFTVRVATFRQEAADAEKVTLDEAGLRKWYDDNTNSIALPERIKLRYVKFDAKDPKFLAKMVVTEDEMRDRYDANVDKYTTTDTNGVEQVKKFEEVKGELEKELREIAAVECYATNLSFRVYGGTPAPQAGSRLDAIAKAYDLKVETSDWFTVDGAFKEGFMVRAESVAPGAEEFADKVAELDPASEDLRYAILRGTDAVWLVEQAEKSPAHVPTFEEAKEIVRPRALRAAKADAFKASVEAIAAKGTNAVLATSNVSTNFTFALVDLKPDQFPNARAVAGAVRKLAPGEVSEFTSTGLGRGILVVCTDRKAGDPAQAAIVRDQIVRQVAMLQQRAIPEAWQKQNLARLGFEPGEVSSVEETAEEDE